jgi:putative phosphoribosyl transferase
MRCQTDLLIIPGAGHLFEEPGTLDRALVGAVNWFTSHLAGEPR